MTLMYLTACDSDGRDYTILLDVARIAAIAPYAEPSPRTLWLSDSRSPGNRKYLRVVMGPEREYVVLASEWPRLKQMLTRLNGVSFNRFDNDTEGFECPQYLQAPTTDATAREEVADIAYITNSAYAAALREDLSANVVPVGVDMGAGVATCSSSR